MIGKIFLLTACCCASLLSVSASDESENSSSTTLHDEMKEVANLIAFLTKQENREYLEGKFKEVNLPSDSSRDALNAFVEILDDLGEDVPFETTLFDDYVLGNLKHQDPDDIFKSLLERVPLIKKMLSEFNAFLSDNPPRMLATGKDKMTEYYKEHISKKDAKVKDYTFLVKFCNDFLNSESPFMRICKHLNTYEELVKKTPSKTPSPTSSSQGTTTTQPSQDSAAQNTSASNLNGHGKPAGSSFTFGGLTVATLCYFVLSAF
uniref:Merozoite surface antigen-2b n=1 Tax=Babesia bovis TaxID=5865 RepID=M1V277_BABBO|nr:merozoite surface antigen-2b [Babesia bovis]BAN78774.1 merozoite surface antigen-2b [Babesia bovis]